MQERGGKVGGRTLAERAWDGSEVVAPTPGRQSLVQLSHAAMEPAAPAAAPSGSSKQARAAPQLPSYSSILRCFGGPVQRASGGGSVGDIDEHASDQAADHAVQEPSADDQQLGPGPTGFAVQRKAVESAAAVFDERSPQPEVATPDETAGPVLRSPLAARVANDDSALDASGLAAASRADSGFPAPDGIRSRVEAVTGADLSDVRLHRGAAAEMSAAALDARAWALGRDVHFGAGQYCPGTADGDHLIAHELVHTAQQAQCGPVTQRKLDVSRPGDPSELEADALADRATGRDVSASGAARAELARPQRPAGVAVRASAPVVQPSFISFAVKMGAKKASKAMLEKFLKEQIKDQIEKIAIKKFTKQFAKEADQILSILEDPWWVTAVGFIPIIGDAFDLVHVPKQIATAIKKADQLEERVKHILSVQGKRASELLSATLKRSESYADELAEKTYAEIVEMAGSSQKAAKMKKLIEQSDRLMEKL